MTIELDTGFYLGLLLVVLLIYMTGHAAGRKAAVSALAESNAGVEQAKSALASANAAVEAATKMARTQLEPTAAFVAPVAVGERFTYLGAQMLCTAHTVGTQFGLLNGVRAEYLSQLGSVCLTTFTGEELDALKAELERGAA